MTLKLKIKQDIQQCEAEKKALGETPDKCILRDYLVTRIATLKDVLNWIEQFPITNSQAA